MIKDLSITRQEIDRVDKEIVKLVEERMHLAEDVAQYKRETGKPIYDKDREEEKLNSLAFLTHSEFNAMGIRELFSQIMSISRRYQYGMVEDLTGVDSTFTCVDRLPIEESTKVVYSGVPGAFAESAMVKYFGENVDGHNVDGFEEVARLVSSGEMDYGVLPFENSTAGFVSGIYDLLDKYELTILGEQIIKVNQCLLGLEGAEISDIKTVYSHPQGLMQGKNFLADKNWQQISMGNTALAAKKVKDDKDKSKAAIASERAAQIYGLNILKSQVNESERNATRFVIVGKKRIYLEEANRVAMSFSIKHEYGTLYNVLGHFLFNHVNMTAIESVPMENRQWEYIFFVDVEGNLKDSEIKSALKAVSSETENFKVLGCYKSSR